MKKSALVILPIATLGLFCFSLFFGRFGFDLTDPQFQFVLLELRLPRTLAAVGVGVTAAMATVLLQITLRNSVAEPGLFGISAFASLGTVISLLIGFKFGSIESWVFAVGLSLVGITPLVWAANRISRVSVQTRGPVTTDLAVIGVAFGAFALALLGIASFVVPDSRLRSIALWAFGSLSLQTNESATTLILLAIALTAVSIWASRGIGKLALGAATLQGLGISRSTLITAALILTALLSATSAFAAGSIGFLGLLSATLSRFVFPRTLTWQLVGATLFSASTLLLADVLARNLFAPLELPVGLLTSAIGAPLLVWILSRSVRASGISSQN